MFYLSRTFYVIFSSFEDTSFPSYSLENFLDIKPLGGKLLYDFFVTSLNNRGIEFAKCLEDRKIR